MTVSAFVQDPNVSRKYGIDWALDSGVTITDSVWEEYQDDGATLTTEIVTSTAQFTNSPTPKTAVTVSYPVPVVGKTHYVTNHITASDGQTGDHSLIILCSQE